MDERRIEGKKITFTVQEMLCEKKTYADAVIPIDLMDIGAVEKLRNAEYTGGGVPEDFDFDSEEPFFAPRPGTRGAARGIPRGGHGAYWGWIRRRQTSSSNGGHRLGGIR